MMLPQPRLRLHEHRKLTLDLDEKPGTDEEVVAYCTGQIAHYKVPRHIRIVDAFTMTVTGKAQKFAMRRIMEAELQTTADVTSAAPTPSV